MSEEIFVKYNDIPKQEYILNNNEILDTIPKPIYMKEQSNLQQNKIETRWRFMEIPQDKTIKKIVEISKLIGGKRTYLDKYGNEIEEIINPFFDRFVKKTYYYYSDE
jgi:SAM-dependent MidA family methyltransferase